MSRLRRRQLRLPQWIIADPKRALLVGAIGCVIAGLLGVFVLIAWFSRDLPSPGKLIEATTNSTVFYDRDGKLLFELYKDKNRVPVSLDAIAPIAQKATIAIEDKNFYKHSGVSNTGILRSLFNLIVYRRIQGGGSTITQQLIKNVLLDSRQTPTRKIKEIILAISVESKYTKNQILEMYLNEAPYGGSYYGIGSAAKGYFNKTPAQLSIVEAAVLAGLPQSPSVYSPFIGEKDAWKPRTKDVLRRMREDGYITRKEEETALTKMNTLVFSQSKMAISAPHFVFFIRSILEKEFGSKIMDQGLKVTTTLSSSVQQTAEKITKEEIEKLKGYKVENGAVVVLDSATSEILAMVGSYNYNDLRFGNFNAATSLRQPGSTVKPITYALAFEKGYTPSSVLMDVKTSYPNGTGGDYTPVNYDGKFRGPMQLRFGLANSINTTAVKLIGIVGVKPFLELASSMGLTTLSPTQENMNRFGLSITLGGGEVSLLDLTNAFSVFARGGVRLDHSAILEVKDHKGKTLMKRRPGAQKKVLSAETAFLISHILSDNTARSEVFGLNSYLNVPGKTVAVKTGTTDDKRDNWAVGYTKSISAGVWVGNNDNAPMDPRIASGATGASPIWYRLMREVLKKYSDGIIDKPGRVKALQVDTLFGGLPKDGGSSRSEYFVEGTEPKETSPFYKKVRISKKNGKIANEMEIKKGEYEERECYVVTESDPVSTDGKNRWQEGIDAWRREQSDDKWKCPTDISDNTSDEVIVSIKNPSDKTTVQGNTIPVKVKITSLSPLKQVKIYLNNNEVRSWNEDKRDFEEVIAPQSSEGVFQLRVWAKNDKDKEGDSVIVFGLNKAWDSISPTPVPTTVPSPTVLTPVPTQ